MCITGSDPVAATTTTLDTLAAEDVAALDDTTVREQVAELMRLSHRLHAELVRRVDVFDRRGLAEPDGFRTTRTWLQAFTSVSGAVAHRLVKAARLLRHLPQLAAATQTGDVCPEQVGQVARLADQIGAEQVTDVEETLTDAAAALDPGRFQIVCDRIRAHIDPDGPEPRHQHEQRGLTLSTLRGMLILRGGLPPAIIGMSPHVAPPPFAEAVIVADSVAWEGAPASFAAWYAATRPAGRQLLARAVVFRLVTAATMWPDRPERVAAEANGYRPVIALTGARRGCPG